jgi:hypothetical protein
LAHKTAGCSLVLSEREHVCRRCSLREAGIRNREAAAAAALAAAAATAATAAAAAAPVAAAAAPVAATAAAAAVVAQDAGDGSSSSAFQAADPAVRTQVPPSRTVALHGGWLSKVRPATSGITSRDVRPNEVSPWRTRRLRASTLCLRPRRSNTACHAARTPARCRINIYLNPQCRCWHPAACHTARSAAGCTTSTPSVDAGAQQHVIQLAQQQGAPSTSTSTPTCRCWRPVGWE